MKFQEFLNRYQNIPVGVYLNQVDASQMVSVCVQTYQHVNFIRECLEGILMQETDFSFEILLGEDASSDGTREICIEYAEKYPGKIKLFLHHRENNIAIREKSTGRFNFLYNLFTANGKYIALCEGDDYWTDPKKLQKQVDFLENHKEFVMSFHDVIAVDQDSKKIDKKMEQKTPKRTYLSIDMFLGCIMPTASSVIRGASLKSALIAEIIKVFNADTFLHAQLAKYGGAYYHENMLSAAYRFHPGGMWSSASKYYNIKESLITTLYIYRTLDDDAVRSVLKKRINRSYFALLKYQIKSGKIVHFFRSALSFIIFLIKDDFSFY